MSRTTRAALSFGGAGALLFLGSFLLFQLEMIVSKSLLPAFGGSASVWSVAMVFFQAALLAGYAWADLSRRFFSPQVERCAFIAIALLACGAAALRLDESGNAVAIDSPVISLLEILLRRAFLPFFLLALFSPLVQSWIASARLYSSPYYLYALSNIGSLLGLLSYPFIVERHFALDAQMRLWIGLFFLFSAGSSILAIAISRGAADYSESASGSRPEPGRKLVWFLISCTTSMLFLALTNHLSQDIAALPLLWVIPLALYLLSFIIQFSSWSIPRWWAFLPALVMVPLLDDPSLSVNASSVSHATLFGCVALFCACLTLHGELYRLRPRPAYMTGYYLLIAAGGAVGSIFVGIVAPYIFVRIWELSIAAGLFFVMCAISFFLGEGALTLSTRGTKLFRALIGVSLLIIWLDIPGAPPDTITERRTFYGLLRVTESRTGPDAPLRALIHGTVLHGIQYLDPQRELEPTTYFVRRSAPGILLSQRHVERPLRVGAVGLGVGTIAAYLQPGDYLRFYEIDPEVLRIASTDFTFIRKTRGTVETVIGDGRLSLEGESPGNYDVLFLDAFSGDSIPVHLLTLEAFRSYERHLNPAGVLVTHCSNRHIDLVPVLLADARALGWPAVVYQTPSPRRDGSLFVAMARDAHALDSLRDGAVAVDGKIPVQWTDSYSNVVALLRY